MIAAAQGWKCTGQACAREAKLLQATFEIDHIIALRNGGSNNLDNLTALCPTCHRNKSIYDNNPDTYERHTGKSKYFFPGPLAHH